MPITFDPALHVYRTDGKEVPSVTQLLHQYGLIPPLPPEAQAAQEHKRRIGERVHTATACIDRGERYQVDDETRPFVDAYVAFRRACGFVPTAIEVPYVGKLCGVEIGMRPDRTGTIFSALTRRDEPTIFDIKCVANQQAHWRLQTSGYALLLPQPLVAPYRWARRVIQLIPALRPPYRLRVYNENADLDCFRAIAILQNDKTDTDAARHARAVIEAWGRKHGVQS